MLSVPKINFNHLEEPSLQEECLVLLKNSRKLPSRLNFIEHIVVIILLAIQIPSILINYHCHRCNFLMIFFSNYFICRFRSWNVSTDDSGSEVFTTPV